MPSHPGENTPKWWEQVVETKQGKYVDTGAPQGESGKFGWQQRNKSVTTPKYVEPNPEGGSRG